MTSQYYLEAFTVLLTYLAKNDAAADGWAVPNVLGHGELKDVPCSREWWEYPENDNECGMEEQLGGIPIQDVPATLGPLLAPPPIGEYGLIMGKWCLDALCACVRLCSCNAFWLMGVCVPDAPVVTKVESVEDKIC